MLIAWMLVTAQTLWNDPSPHKTQMVEVEKAVVLEVLDWGGVGKPLVLLAGRGNTAHVYDDFAPKLARMGRRVYGITRRGFGNSSVPMSGYDVERLAADVVAVLSILRIDRPVLVGHSLAGQELSAIANLHRDRIAGLVYLDAMYSFSFYSPAGDYVNDAVHVKRKIEEMLAAMGNGKATAEAMKALLDVELPALQKSLRAAIPLVEREPEYPEFKPDLSSFAALDRWFASTQGYRYPQAEYRQWRTVTAEGRPGPRRFSANVIKELSAGWKRWKAIPAPGLVIIAHPQDLGPQVNSNEALRSAFESWERASFGPEFDAAQKALPHLKFVRIPHAHHYVFLSHDKQVLDEINAFLGTLEP